MRYRYQYRDRVYEISIQRHGEAYRAAVNGEAFELEVLDVQPGILSLRLEGRPVTLYWANSEGQKWVSLDGCTYLLEKPAPRTLRHRGERSSEDILRAPMPAQVRAIQAGAGELVEKGQTLLLLEAMKMEIRLQAPRSGRITAVVVTEGQSVERDQILVELSDA